MKIKEYKEGVGEVGDFSNSRVTCSAVNFSNFNIG
jgi:hypothetical protein